MTEAQEIAWDAMQQELVEVTGRLTDFLIGIPDTSANVLARNRVLMALESIDRARDQLSAARDRYTEAQEAQ